MISEIPNHHTHCQTCRASFPKAWTKTGGAVQKGTHFWCSEKCYENRPSQVEFRPVARFRPQIENETWNTI